ncbi:G2E3 ligase, partial [Brachypteracias leptosomus]|nr:G2E3 ligase [Brachypteracias leptosomus]
CYVCSKRWAATTCWEAGCRRSFHLPCAAEGGCVTQYFLEYRAFCSEHRPEQLVEVVPDKQTTCLICLEPVEDSKSYNTLVCPMCKNGWFHRGCIQGQALHDGITQLRCPLCRNTDDFRGEMLRLGIRIPFRLPDLDPEEEAELNYRHGRCDATRCLCPGGREWEDEEGPWQLLLCSSCAAEGTHRCCSQLEDSRETWECQSC